MRKRMNNHISCCRLGTGTNIFDRHVYFCKTEKNMNKPFFKIYAYMTITNEEDLCTYVPTQ